ncbi:unnamed protein product [Rotaria sp. Silwood1]|nr:unnamed protein product [Rotaria sp. Silwood1]CAF1470318.1 unnamed protein product [Rotaria sp. Silwood1]CAF3365791.1 unnamed protein product [Rotaria sp. Silwood1]CAF3642993.1 unnamed protein product [Rotaria sp. Silwood1]CAF3685384.1 unnamed protein product [Rotaria sp. Silwood1]
MRNQISHGKHIGESLNKIFNNIDSDQISELTAAIQECFDTKDSARTKAFNLKAMEVAKNLLDKSVGSKRRDTLDKFLDDYYYKRLATRDRMADINKLNALIVEYMKVLSEDEGVKGEQLGAAFVMSTKENHKEYVRQIIEYARKCAKGEPLNRRNQLRDFLEDNDED